MENTAIIPEQSQEIAAHFVSSIFFFLIIAEFRHYNEIQFHQGMSIEFQSVTTS